MPDINAFAAFGFTDVSKHFAQPYPEASIPTDDWPFFYMIERTYPVSYMIALGMVLLLSYMFVRKTIGLTGPIERGYLPFFFLGAGFMLVETKAITELGLHLGGTWFVIAATIVLVLVMAFLANLMVQGKVVQRTGVAYVGLMASLLVGYFYARNHGLVTLGSPQANPGGELCAAHPSVVLFGHCLFDLDRQGRCQHLHRACLQSDGGSVWRIDGIQLDVFRIFVPVSAGDGFLFPGMDVFLGSGRGMDAAEAGHSCAGFGALRKAMTVKYRHGAPIERSGRSTFVTP